MEHGDLTSAKNGKMGHEQYSQSQNGTEKLIRFGTRWFRPGQTRFIQGDEFRLGTFGLDLVIDGHAIADEFGFHGKLYLTFLWTTGWLSVLPYAIMSFFGVQITHIGVNENFGTAPRVPYGRRGSGGLVFQC